MRAERAVAGLGIAGLTMVMLGTGVPVPAAAQQTPNNVVPPSGQSGAAASLPDGTVRKAGAALRDIAQIRQGYSQRMQTARTQNEQRGLLQQANAAELQAVSSEGLSVDQYNQVIRLAQADPGLKQRLLSAAQQAP